MGETTLEKFKMTFYDKASTTKALEFSNRYLLLLKKFVPKIDMYK